MSAHSTQMQLLLVPHGNSTVHVHGITAHVPPTTDFPHVSAYSQNNATPLMLAAQRGELEHVHLLTCARADITAVDAVSGHQGALRVPSGCPQGAWQPRPVAP
jgi:hypothetical protein